MTTHPWADQSIFYHIYPLGLCAAPQHNDFSSAPVPRLEALYAWLDHIQALGANALYLGPLFESTSHGYDTADYFNVDRRLGSNRTLADFSREVHRRGMRLILDGVFNHTGRDFWAFRELRSRGEASGRAAWYHNLRFGETSPCGDAFSYEGWNGHYSLAKLNSSNPEVRRHLFDAVRLWVDEFQIDGLRLDAADCLDIDFWQAFSAHCRSLRPDFWLLGEVIHGDYTRWAHPGTLDSVTNYEAYKGLYSSLNDANYFEIAYALERQFGEQGLYRGLALYNFADNHDVDRVASLLHNPAHLYPLYLLLFSMPGVPSIYYGSEFGLPGKRLAHSDAPLRPALNLAELRHNAPHLQLPESISRLASLRRSSPALRSGGYLPLHVGHLQMAFLRCFNEPSSPEENVLVALNAAPGPARLELRLPAAPGNAGGMLEDLLNPGHRFEVHGGTVSLPLDACWGRILRWNRA